MAFIVHASIRLNDLLGFSCRAFHIRILSTVIDPSFLVLARKFIGGALIRKGNYFHCELKPMFLTVH